MLVKALNRSMRGLVMPLVSVIGLPVPDSRPMMASTDSLGYAARNTAIAPATCGAACEVPLWVMPAAVIDDPGASRVRKLALLEKQVTWSA